GHNLGGVRQALEALNAFFAITMSEKPYPVIAWDMRSGEESAVLTIKLEEPSSYDATLWSAASDDRDFRDEKWKHTNLGFSNTSTMEVRTEYPKSGYKAFYVDLKYQNPNGGNYTVSTRVFLTDTMEVL